LRRRDGHANRAWRDLRHSSITTRACSSSIVQSTREELRSRLRSRRMTTKYWPCNSNSVCLGSSSSPAPEGAFGGLRAFGRNPGSQGQPGPSYAF
jgi:hypothetical protein